MTEIQGRRIIIHQKKNNKTNKKVSDKSRAIGTYNGLMNKGKKMKPSSHEQREMLRFKDITNNPLKNPEIKKKHLESMRSKETREKLRRSGKRIHAENRNLGSFKFMRHNIKLSNRRFSAEENRDPILKQKRRISKMKTQDEKIKPIKHNIINDYIHGMAFWRVAEKYHLGGRYLRRLFKEERIRIRTCNEQAKINKGLKNSGILIYTPVSQSIPNNLKEVEQ